jgi:hypothetical protein
MKREVEEEIQEVIEPKKGREAFMEMYRAGNPEAGDIGDEALFEYAHGRHAENEKRYGDLEGKYNKHVEANENLAKTILKDPKAAEFMQLVGEGKSFPYAQGRSFGKEGYGLEGEALDEFEKGYQDNLAALAESDKLLQEAQANTNQSLERLEKFGKENKLSEEQRAGLQDALMQFSENVLMGVLSDELIDMVYKGLNYDKDIEDAAHTGKVEGANEEIGKKLLKKKDLGAPSLSSASKRGDAAVAAPKKKGFYESFEDIKY